MEIRGRNNLVVADLCNMFVNHKLLKVSTKQGRSMEASDLVVADFTPEDISALLST